MIKVYSSKAGQGKSITLLIDAIIEVNKGRTVAFIALEMSAKLILERSVKIMDHFDIRTSKNSMSFVPFQGSLGNDYDLFKHIEELKGEFDVICIDGFDMYQSLRLRNTIETRKENLNFLIDLLDSENCKCIDILISSNCNTSCTSEYDSSKIEPRTMQNLPEEILSRIVNKKYSTIKRSEVFNTSASFLEIIDFENQSITECNITEILNN